MTDQDELRTAVNAACDCGDGDTGDCCPACEVWHQLKDKKWSLRITALEEEVRDYEASMANANARIRWLEGFKGVLERVALAAGCLPSEFPDAYGHVLDAVSGLTDRVKELEGEAERLRSQLVHDAAVALEQHCTQVANLEAVIAPLLPLFRERAEDWERMNSSCEPVSGRERRPLPMPDTITLTAEFPVPALRALVPELSACPLCAGRGYVPDPRFPGSARVVWCSCPAGGVKRAEAEHYSAGDYLDDFRAGFERGPVGTEEFAAGVDESMADRAEGRADAVLEPDGREKGRR